MGDSAGSLTDLSATALRDHIRRRELSALEVAEAHLRRIEAVNPAINAVIVSLAAQARAAAEAADAAASRGEWLGDLHGVPMTIKDQFRVAGTATSAGLRRLAGRIDDADGPTVGQLRAQGAIFLGKTNVMQALAGWESDNGVFGRTNNPWDVARTPGGSSGGEAAIIAGRGVPLGLGGDLGGSIRIPAHFCGIHGFLPTAGRFTAQDTPMDAWDTGMQAIVPQIGPLARHVDDLELLLEAMSRPTAQPRHDAPPVPWRPSREVDVAKLRVAVWPSNGYFEPSPAISRAVVRAGEHLRAAGVALVQFSPPPAEEIVHLFVAALTSNGGRGLAQRVAGETPVTALRTTLRASTAPRWIRPLVAAVLGLAGQSYLPPLVRAGGPRSAADYWTLVARCQQSRIRFLESLEGEGIDALICPVAGVVAAPHGLTENLLPAASYAFVVNLLGCPAGTVAATRVRPGEEGHRPSGPDVVHRAAARTEFGSAGMPAGVQVFSRPWRDEIALALMRVLEAGFRGDADYPECPADRTSA